MEPKIDFFCYKVKLDRYCKILITFDLIYSLILTIYNFSNFEFHTQQKEIHLSLSIFWTVHCFLNILIRYIEKNWRNFYHRLYFRTRIFGIFYDIFFYLYHFFIFYEFERLHSFRNTMAVLVFIEFVHFFLYLKIQNIFKVGMRFENESTFLVSSFGGGK